MGILGKSMKFVHGHCPVCGKMGFYARNEALHEGPTCSHDCEVRFRAGERYPQFIDKQDNCGYCGEARRREAQTFCFTCPDLGMLDRQGQPWCAGCKHENAPKPTG